MKRQRHDARPARAHAAGASQLVMREPINMLVYSVAIRLQGSLSVCGAHLQDFPVLAALRGWVQGGGAETTTVITLAVAV